MGGGLPPPPTPLRPTAGVPIPEENWYPVVVEVVDLVLDLFRRESNMPIWRIGGWIVPGGLDCLYINVPCVE